jgi:hypothetical protein
MPSKSEYKVSGEEWVGSWVHFMDHVEYWRLFQSAQFLHLHSVREAQNREWMAQLLARAMDRSQLQSPRALSVENVLYTFSEIFEFAARLAQRDLFDEALRLDIAIIGIRHFVLVADFGRAWDGGYFARQNTSRRSWEMATADLVAGSAEYSLEATGWFFRECGFESSMDVFKPEQARFLAGLR